MAPDRGITHSGMTRSAMKKVQSPPKAPVVRETTPAARNTATTARISSNAYATGSNQNSGNFITDRPTTKVHAPPGGRSQISFGDDTTTDRSAVKKVSKVQSPPKAPVVRETTPAARNTTTTARISSNAYATGSNQNSGNFITDRPTTKVHAPPGGRSQISFGDDTTTASKPTKTPVVEQTTASMKSLRVTEKPTQRSKETVRATAKWCVLKSIRKRMNQRWKFHYRSPHHQSVLRQG